jgi:hypothetical protein
MVRACPSLRQARQAHPAALYQEHQEAPFLAHLAALPQVHLLPHLLQATER